MSNQFPDDDALQRALRDTPPEDLRHRVARAALDYRAAWVVLGGRIQEVVEETAWRGWGYRSLRAWAQSELGLPATLVSRLTRGFRWLQEEAPELQAQWTDAGESTWSRPVPDLQAVVLLDDARHAVEASTMDEPSYQDLRGRVLRGEEGAAAVRKEVRRAMLGEDADTDPALKTLRKMYEATERLLKQFREMGEENTELIDLASAMRNRLDEAIRKREHAAGGDGDDLVDTDDGPPPFDDVRPASTDDDAYDTGVDETYDESALPFDGADETPWEDD